MKDPDVYPTDLKAVMPMNEPSHDKGSRRKKVRQLLNHYGEALQWRWNDRRSMEDIGKAMQKVEDELTDLIAAPPPPALAPLTHADVVADYNAGMGKGETPRTDALIEQAAQYDLNVVWPDLTRLARQLERELTGANEQARQYAETLGKYRATHAASALSSTLAPGALVKIKAALKEALDERLQQQHEYEADARKWESKGDMFGWNFHMGMAAGGNGLMHCFYRVLKAVEEAEKEAVSAPSAIEPKNVSQCLTLMHNLWNNWGPRMGLHDAEAKRFAEALHRLDEFSDVALPTERKSP